ncbi:hypothetical protein [Cryobacterium sp. Y57]|uniref:hypothetical protein n=1 Tax=Cryobacterium sp. Y57 TaxID=2048287 RepID=UPI000CE44A2D|nr:hypothetical protein [Cryobacterium sp. Y57]
MADFAMSHHALSRAVDMAVDASEILAAFQRPRDRFYSDRTRSEWRTRGRITVCVAADSDGLQTVTTILWAKASGWVADAEHPSAPGRDLYDLGGARRMAKMRKKSRNQ